MSETICQNCCGEGTVAVFVDYADRGEFRPNLRCSDCGGTGTWTAERLSAYERGQKMRQDRIARGESFREAARRLGISPAQLSAIERGKPPAQQEPRHE